MIAKQNLTLAPAYSSPFAHESPLAYHKSRFFFRLRTLCALLSREISRNPSRINRFRTLHKTTEGSDLSSDLSTVQTLPHSDLQASLTPLESKLTKNRTTNCTRNTPVSS